MAKNAESTIDVKLFVDKEKQKVLFAESGKDFVDVLFSWLTLPLGTIVRLLGKQSQVGCLDQVYKSVEDLSTDFFQTKACKTMLLAPLNAASGHCRRLKINVDDTNPRAVYVCKDMSCSARLDCAFSAVPDTICKCGEAMEYAGDMPENHGNIAPAGGSDSGVFVKGSFKYVITDDLIVAPASTSLMLSLCEKFGVQGPANLEQTIIQLTPQKITSLLERSLTSKQPLTGLYFDIPIDHDDADLYVLSEKLYPAQQNDAEHKLNSVSVRILQTKNNSSVLYAEVCDVFVDIVFGLLTIPLGSIIKTYGQCSLKGCAYNVYESMDESTKEWVRPECQSLLIAPLLAPFCGSGASKIVQVEELAPRKLEINSCFNCFKIGGFSGLGRCRELTPILSRRGNLKSYQNNCENTWKTTILNELNPKSPKGKPENGEAYVKGAQKFIVTDDLRIIPLSMSSTLQVVSEAKVQMGELQEKEMTLTKSQVMEIQRAALMGRNALSSVLVPPKKTRTRPDHLTSGVY